jgi:hypothetical protein
MTKHFVRQRLAKESMRSYARREMIRKGLMMMKQDDDVGDASEAATFAETAASFDTSLGTTASMFGLEKGTPTMDIFHPDFWSYCAPEENFSTSKQMLLLQTSV